MFNIIPVSLLIMALGGIVYITSSHLSEFSDNGDFVSNGGNDSETGLRTKFAGWVKLLPLSGVKAQSLYVTQKMLHRLRILLLKTDNKLMKIIGKISKEDKMAKYSGEEYENSMEKAENFWEDLSNYKQEASETENPETPKTEPEIIAEPEIKIALVAREETGQKIFDIKPAKKTARAVKKTKRAK